MKRNINARTRARMIKTLNETRDALRIIVERIDALNVEIESCNITSNTTYDIDALHALSRDDLITIARDELQINNASRLMRMRKHDIACLIVNASNNANDER